MPSLVGHSDTFSGWSPNLRAANWIMGGSLTAIRRIMGNSHPEAQMDNLRKLLAPDPNVANIKKGFAARHRIQRNKMRR